MLKKILLVLPLLFVFAGSTLAQGTATETAPAKTAEPAKKPAVFRPTKDQIEQVQTMLKEKKLYTGEASGKYNDDTRAGIKSFQKDNGLAQTGTLNRATLEKFGVTLTDSQKASPVLESSFAKSSDDAKPAKTKAEPKAAEPKTAASGPSAASTETKKPAPFRANADQVKAAQKILKDGKMYAGEETGKLDDPTREGLKKYQEAKSLKVTGTLNAATLEKMGVTLTDAQKANVAAQAAYDAAKKN
ncbi:MAG: peptidoglycan-binding domain-containing protein [Pyrinomonadaceae bacterium]